MPFLTYTQSMLYKRMVTFQKFQRFKNGNDIENWVFAILFDLKSSAVM